MSRRPLITTTALALSTGLVLFSFAHSATAVEAPVDLGTASSYSVLAHSTVTNTNVTNLSGDLGLNPGTAVADTGSLIVGGATNIANAPALQAKNDLDAAYTEAAGRSYLSLSGVELASQTIAPGAWESGGVLANSGNLTLDAQNDPNAVFIFKSTATLITGTGSTMTLINGADACNVFWVVPSSATLGTSSTFVGTIMAYADVAVLNSVTVQGRAMARTGQVTLDNDTFTSIPCSTPTPSPTASESPSASASATEEAAAPTLANTGLELWVVWLIALAIFAGIVTYLFGHLKRRRNSSGS